MVERSFEILVSVDDGVDPLAENIRRQAID